MLVVPHERYPEVEAKVDTLRREDKRLLRYGTDLLNEELSQMSVPVSSSQLTPGKQYGVVVYHPDANAVRNGEVVAHHGEVYIEVWTWTGPVGSFPGEFYNVNAWGGISTVKSFRVPVLELP